jgi:branched chain amino acid efflux pump
MLTARTEFLGGVKALLPILLGVIPFGMISGIAVTQARIPPVSGFVMSLLVFSGAAFIVALQLIGSGAPALIVLFSALLVNLRFMIYSASLAPLLRNVPAAWKSTLAYVLSDQAYAASINHLTGQPTSPIAWLHLLGSGLAMWLAWQISVAIGILAGARLPASWSLEFTIPLTFLALAVPAIKDRFTAAAALVAAVVAVLASGAPFKLGLVTAAVIGILAGMLLEGRAG